MKPLFLAKIILLSVMLIGVLYSIRQVNGGAVQRAFQALGLQAGSGEAPGFHPANRPLAPGEKSFNLCPNRIHAVVWSERRKVEEFRDGMKLKWIAVDPAPRELGYMEIEKWLSAHCKIAVKPVADSSATYADYISVRYIDGTELKIGKAADGSFRAAGATPEAFQSPDLASALEELEKIAQLKPL